MLGLREKRRKNENTHTHTHSGHDEDGPGAAQQRRPTRCIFAWNADIVTLIFVSEVVTVQSEPEEQETMSSAESLEASSSESDDVNSVDAIPDDELRHTRSAVASHLVSMEDAARACGIIERSWIHYAVEMLHDSELAML